MLSSFPLEGRMAFCDQVHEVRSEYVQMVQHHHHNHHHHHQIPYEVRGESCYLDMGVLYGYVVSNCMVWWPEPISINQSQLDAFLDPLFQQLTREGVNHIEFAFTQLADIAKLDKGVAGTPTDKITDIFADNYPVGLTGENLFEYMIAKAHDYQVQTELSYGGAIATAADWTLQGAPASQAKLLAQLVDKYNLDALDFDIESGDIMQVNKPADVVTFFKQLHTHLHPSKRVILTVMGDAPTWAGNILKPLFTQFDQMFDGVNLMLYSNTQYYLDANNPTWGINLWLTYVPDPSKICIGFYDKIAYEDPASSAGRPYNVSGLTRGQAAAKIFLDLLADLHLTRDQVAEPFWWTDTPTTLAQNQVLSDFYQYLSTH
jgi:hypothetical protein